MGQEAVKERMSLQEELEAKGQRVKEILISLASLIKEEDWSDNITQDRIRCLPLFHDNWFEEGEVYAIFPNGSIMIGDSEYVPPDAFDYYQTTDGYTYGNWREIPIEDYYLKGYSREAIRTIGAFLAKNLHEIVAREFPRKAEE